jgi:hypothetical protein
VELGVGAGAVHGAGVEHLVARTEEGDRLADRLDHAGGVVAEHPGVVGSMMIRKPVDLRFRLKITGDQAEMAGQASLNRTAFGVGQGTFTATDQIPAKVVVVTRISAQAASSRVPLP